MAQAIQTQPKTAIAGWDREMVKMRPQLEMVLPPHLAVDRLARTVRATLVGAPALLNANRSSLWKAIMSACVFGLEVDGRQSAIIPFKGMAQWIPMVNGLVTIAWNSGFVVQGEVVRQKDDFDVTLGTERSLYHKPARGAAHDSENEIIGAYATASSASMRPVFEWMDLPDIIRVRNGSKGYQHSGNRSVWATDFRGMARKTPVRALCNHLPWNVQRANEVEDEVDAGRVAWAERKKPGDGEDAITVEYAEFDDETPATDTRPAAKKIDAATGEITTEADHAEQMKSDGAAVEASNARGNLV